MTDHVISSAGQTPPRHGALKLGSPSPLRPIRVRLSLVFVILLLLVIGLGVFSIDQLASFHSVSAKISGRWLQSTRLLGDLNNSISDYRTAEGDLLIATTPADIHTVDQQIAKLDGMIAATQARYDNIEHDAAERELYGQFVMQWTTYRELAKRVRVTAKSGDLAGAAMLYHGESRTAYDKADDTLTLLTERTVAGATAETEREAQAYRDARQWIFGAIAVAACLVVLAVAYLAFAVSRPIAGLVERMHRIANNDPQIDIPGLARRDELGDIARAVARFRDNTIELGRSKDALQDMLVKERRMAELQRNFISMASHEFRTPLNVIDGHAQRLMRMRELPSPEMLEERCGRIRAAVQRMTHLMDRLLDSSQWLDSTTPAALRYAEFSLPALVHEVCEMHRDSSPAARIEEIVNADTPSIFYGDARLLFQTFSNLIGNAIKYSPSHAQVTVRISSDATNMCVSVVDQGIGIAERDIDHLFERYIRGGNVAGTVGAGVGLYLVKLVVELHHGSIAVSSVEGRGSQFIVRLPRGRPTNLERPT